MENKNEHKILESLKNKDKSIYNNIYDNFYLPLVWHSMKYLHDINLAEDMVQDLFIQIWQKDIVFDTLNAFKCYLFTSIRNKSLNHIKHLKVKEKLELVILNENEIIFNPELEKDKYELYKRAYSIVDTLPNKCKQVFLMHINGYKNLEISESLEISLNTVKTHKKNAFEKLKRQIAPLIN